MICVRFVLFALGFVSFSCSDLLCVNRALPSSSITALQADSGMALQADPGIICSRGKVGRLQKKAKADGGSEVGDIGLVLPNMVAGVWAHSRGIGVLEPPPYLTTL